MIRREPAFHLTEAPAPRCVQTFKQTLAKGGGANERSDRNRMDRPHLKAFNPWMGCQKVSQGCRFCYAEVLTKGRMQLDVFGPNTAKRQRTSERYWRGPLNWNRQAQTRRDPLRVFCASLADVFEDAPELNAWRRELWDVIDRTRWLDWQLLTKRPENIERMLPDTWDANSFGYWPHVWLGTSIERNEVRDRSHILTAVPAHVHFISYEPAIGPADDVDLEGISWVIVGGESGPGYRPMKLSWARDMQTRCAELSVRYFFKQDSSHRSEQGADALGRIYRDYPESWNRQPLSF